MSQLFRYFQSGEGQSGGATPSSAQPEAPITPSASKSKPRQKSTPVSPSDQLSDEMRELNTRLATFLQDIGSLESRKNLLEDELEREKEQQNALLHEMRIRTEKEISDLKAYCEQLQNQNRELRDDLRREQDRTQAKLNNAHQKHIEDLARQRKEMEAAHSGELDRIRAEGDAQHERACARLNTELDSTRHKLAQALDEYNRLKNEASRADSDLPAQLARVRRENSELQQQLSVKEETHARKLEDLSKRLKDCYDEIARSNSMLIDKDKSLKEIRESNAALFKEVSLYRSLLEKEIARITPSKSKKRKLGAESLFETTDAQPVRQPPSGTVCITKINLDPEEVVLTNTSTIAVDISGWHLKSAIGNREFILPPKTVLQPNHAITVLSNQKQDESMQDDMHLFWSQNAMWQAAGERAVLENATGKLISSLACQ